MKRVYISHPFSGDIEGNRKKVEMICRELNRRGEVLPVSPVHLFSHMDDDSKREEVLAVCLDLVEMVDELWVFGDSAGCREEVEMAERIGLPVHAKIFVTDACGRQAIWSGPKEDYSDGISAFMQEVAEALDEVRHTEDGILQKYITDSLLTENDIRELLDKCAALANKGFKSRAMLHALTELEDRI
jgi:hypothetical protein